MEEILRISGATMHFGKTACLVVLAFLVMKNPSSTGSHCDCLEDGWTEMDEHEKIRFRDSVQPQLYGVRCGKALVGHKWTSERKGSWSRLESPVVYGRDVNHEHSGTATEYQAFAHNIGRFLAHPCIDGIRAMRGTRTNAEIRNMLEREPIAVPNKGKHYHILVMLVDTPDTRLENTHSSFSSLHRRELRQKDRSSQKHSRESNWGAHA